MGPRGVKYSFNHPITPFGGRASNLRVYSHDFRLPAGRGYDTVFGRSAPVKVKLIFVFALLTCLSVFGSLAWAGQSAPEGSTVQQSVDKQKNERGPGKEMASGGGDIAKGVAKGTGDVAKGTAGAVGNLATGNVAGAGASLGGGVVGAGKNVGAGTAKGGAKVGKGLGGELKKLGKKIL